MVAVKVISYVWQDRGGRMNDRELANVLLRRYCPAEFQPEKLEV